MNQIKQDKPWTRRRFIGTSAAGAGMLFVPGILAGCGAGKPTVQPAAPASTDKAPAAPMGGYFTSLGIDEAVIRKVMSVAMDKGGDYADLFFQYLRTNSIGLEDSEVNRATSEVMLGCGVRVIKGDQTGFAFTEDLSTPALISAADTAATIAAGSSSYKNTALNRIETPKYYPIEIPWTDVGVDKKIPFALRADATARSIDKRIAKVKVSLVDTTEHVLIATSDGQITEDDRPMSLTIISCVAIDGKRTEQNSWTLGCRKGFEVYTQDTIDDLAKKAAEHTVILFQAESPPAGEYPIVLAPGLSGILLHEAIGHGMEADFNRKGTSVYANRIGTKIAPEFVSILDDATWPNQRGSINIDDEGTPGQKTVLVENGILKSYLHDRISAKHYGVSSTGNGRRQNYQYPAIPRMRNTYMLSGPHNPEEIIASVKKGIYAETFSNGEVDIGAGDFAFYLKTGYLIEDGKLTKPVKDANMIGFGPKVLEQIQMVGNDLELYSGSSTCGKDGQGVPVSFGLPTVKCASISVGGKK